MPGLVVNSNTNFAVVRSPHPRSERQFDMPATVALLLQQNIFGRLRQIEYAVGSPEPARFDRGALSSAL